MTISIRATEAKAGMKMHVGRVLTIREHGKKAFADLLVDGGKLQFYFETPLGFKVGDIIMVIGAWFTTKTGVNTVEVSRCELLTPATRQLPEKYHGLRDPELRQRQRYLDLIANEDTRKLFRMRSELIRGIREYLHKLGFMEVETPVLQAKAGGATAEPFTAHYNSLNQDMHLRVAPELFLKQLIVGGFHDIFEIGKCFRNEGMSSKHNPEFTILELYAVGYDYQQMRYLCEELIVDVAGDYLGIKLEQHWDEIIWTTPKLYEAGFTAPTFIHNYSIKDFPLAEAHPKDPTKAQCFDLYMPVHDVKPGSNYDGAIEIATGCTELTDPVEQRKRFEEQGAEVDEDFIKALEYGLPPCAGLGIGIDRLVMALARVGRIRDVQLFPQLRSK